MSGVCFWVNCGNHNSDNCKLHWQKTPDFGLRTEPNEKGPGGQASRRIAWDLDSFFPIFVNQSTVIIIGISLKFHWSQSVDVIFILRNNFWIKRWLSDLVWSVSVHLVKMPWDKAWVLQWVWVPYSPYPPTPPGNSNKNLGFEVWSSSLKSHSHRS